MTGRSETHFVLCHLLPHDAELSPKHETGESDQEQAKDEEWDCDQAAKSRSRSYLAVTHRCNCCFHIVTLACRCQDRKVRKTDEGTLTNEDEPDDTRGVTRGKGQ